MLDYFYFVLSEPWTIMEEVLPPCRKDLFERPLVYVEY